MRYSPKLWLLSPSPRPNDSLAPASSALEDLRLRLDSFHRFPSGSSPPGEGGTVSCFRIAGCVCLIPASEISYAVIFCLPVIVTEIIVLNGWNEIKFFHDCIHELSRRIRQRFRWQFYPLTWGS